MKQVLFMLVLISCCTIATAQDLLDKKISFRCVDQSLEQTLLNLSQETGVNISFSTQILNQKELISIDVKKKNIKSILHQLLRGTRLEFDVLKDEILILSKSLKKYTISGIIEDLESGESLIGANLLVQNNKGTSSNEYGFYSITLTEGMTNLSVSYLGFEKKIIKLNLVKDTTLNIKMVSNLTFPEVIVTDAKEDPSLLFKEISTNILDPKEIRKIPALGGIPDVMRASHLLAGVQSGGDGLGGLFVRGGNTDQNLVLLDGVPVYNPTHFVGLLSIFNARAIRSAELIKGGFPARFGGRLSSILDVRIKEGNRNKLSGDASIGLIASSASIEGPFANGKGAFFISGRRSIPDLLIKPLTKRIQINNGIEGFLNYYFYDVNAKANYSLSKKDKIYISFYGGGDRFENPKESIEVTDELKVEEKDNQFLDWGNTIGSIRYNRIWGNKLFSNLTFNFSKYQFATEEFLGSRRTVQDTLQSEEFDFGKYNTAIEDWSAKLDFDYFPNSTTRVKVGVSAIRHEFRPRVISINEDNLLGIGYDIGEDIDSLIVTSPINSVEVDAYLEGETQHTDKIKSNLGIHFASFITGEKNYVSVQPRIAVNIRLRKKWFVNTSFSVSSQYLHLLTRSGIGLPTDLWVPSTKRIKPQGSWIAVAGLGYEGTKGFSIGLETYYKQLTDILTYREGTIFSVIDARNWEDNVDIGDGEAYGIELALKKENRKTIAWLNYTYSFATREFKDVNQGNPYPFRYDRRHFLKAGITHKVTSKFALSMDYVYGTGNAITIATRIFEYYSPFSEEPAVAQVFGEKNSYRIPPYHRLDLGINLSKPKKWGVEEFSFGVYNAYGRLNPLFISLKDNPTISGSKQFFQTSLLSFVPYISYVVSF